MYILFRRFEKKYSLKENFRNSINDLLILATSLYYQDTLVTTDNLLFTFMEEEKELIVNRLNNSFIEISKFKEYEINKNRKASKEYINNSLAILNRKKSNYSIEN